MIVVDGELVPLDDVSQTDKLLSSKEPAEHTDGHERTLFESGEYS